MATEVDDDHVATEEEEEEDDEYGYLSDNLSTDDDADDMDALIHFDLLKVPAEAYKDLPPEERVRWMTAHFIIQKNAYLFKRRGQESKEEEQVSKVEAQVSKVEEESKVVEEEDGDAEEESKVPKTNDDGGSGPRGTSWKSNSKPGGV